MEENLRKKKILYISGTRADYGLMKNTLLEISKNPKLDLEIIATGMHLMPKFGRTLKEIKKDGFKVHKIEAVYKKDSKESAVDFIGKLIQLLNKELKKIKPDIILVLGDRAEALAGAVSGVYLVIPVAHVHGGDVSMTVDDVARHAITKLSSIHFAATEKSSKRIIKMGENPWRVYVVGAPGLDGILKSKIAAQKNITQKYHLDLSKPLLLVIQHPVTAEINRAGIHIEETMSAIKELGYQSIVVYPNADAGSRKMIQVIEKYRKYPFIKIYKNIPRFEYLSLMRIASCIVGNSSGGIIEAPSFGLPAVNIGTRQKGREKSDNVIDVGYKKEDIKKAIKKAIYDKIFRKKTKSYKSPYGSGDAGKKIAKILSEVTIDDRLLNKTITY